MSLLFANNAIGTLASPITSTALALTLNAGQAAAFPSPTPPDVFYATLTDAATQSIVEIVKVSAVSGNVFAIVRAQDGTSPLSWLAGDFVAQRSIALEMRLWNAVVPSGGIIMWSGSIATIPEGWLLCDGTNGTPNLLDRFVVGAGLTYNVGTTGGSADSIVPSHTHTAASASTSTVSDPGHIHGLNGQSYTGYGNAGIVDGGGAGNPFGPQNMNAAVTGIAVAVATTTIVTAAGVSPTGGNLPPYYALAYIMKT